MTSLLYGENFVCAFKLPVKTSIKVIKISLVKFFVFISDIFNKYVATNISCKKRKVKIKYKFLGLKGPEFF